MMRSWNISLHWNGPRLLEPKQTTELKLIVGLTFGTLMATCDGRRPSVGADRRGIKQQVMERRLRHGW